MADPYHSAKAGRLTFKGGSVGSLSKSIDKKKKKKKNIKPKQQDSPDQLPPAQQQEEKEEDIYTIDAAKKMNYQELFPVEAKKFGYVPKDKDNTKAKDKAHTTTTVEDALDDRVKKKADRYCK